MPVAPAFPRWARGRDNNPPVTKLSRLFHSVNGDLWDVFGLTCYRYTFVIILVTAELSGFLGLVITFHGGRGRS